MKSYDDCEKKVNIVVAHYTEDLSWLPSITLPPVYTYDLNIYSKLKQNDIEPVYNQLKSQCKNARCVFVKKLQNIGREGHTYLQHIVSNYETICENPNNITVFLQGKLSDHLHAYGKSTEKQLILDIVEEANKSGRSSSYAHAWNVGGNSAHSGFRTLTSSTLYNGTYKDWFEFYIDPKFPEAVRWWIAALFAVRNDYIACRPKSYYQHILSCLDGICPETVYFLERSWWHIFKKSIII